MILAQGEATNLTPWNDSTDLNLRNFIQKRAAKRIKEINKEVDMAMQPLFDRTSSHAVTTLQVEDAYLRSGKSSTSSINKVGLTSRTISRKIKKGELSVVD